MMPQLRAQIGILTADALAATWDLQAEGISVQLDSETGDDVGPTIQ
jgi:hypothetical protein